jgi:hypothetical protein
VGAMAKFKEGLQPKLLHQIITHCSPAPATLDGWKRKARERQTVYKELKNAGLAQKSNNNCTDTQRRWATVLGIRNYVPPQQRPQTNRQATSYQGRGSNQVVPMDVVDAGHVFTPLSEQEHADLSKKGTCFCCRQPGHISHFCPQKKGQGGGGTTIRVAKVEEPPKEQEQPSIKDAISSMDPKELWGIQQGMDKENHMAIADGAQYF